MRDGTQLTLLMALTLLIGIPALLVLGYRVARRLRDDSPPMADPE